MSLSLNGLRAVTVRLVHPRAGAWIADVDLDLETPTVPSGPAILVIGTTTLLGTIDPDASGRFGDKAGVRVIGGGGGWHRPVTARQFHNDGGVFSPALISATAAEVGERAVDMQPTRLGVDFMRTAGPASRVLAGREWYVDLSGTTIVGPRLPRPQPLDIDVLRWEPEQRLAEIATGEILIPGTILADPRFGTITVSDVEQVFQAGSARATVWCGEQPGSRLTRMLSALVREKGQTKALEQHKYRIVTQGVDGRLTLQAVNRKAGIPDSIAVPVWLGVPGIVAKVVPGTLASVVFLDGDPAQPVVQSFEAADVIELKVGNGLSPVALSAFVDARIAAVVAAFNSHVHPTGVGPSGPPAVPLATQPTVASTKLKSD